MLKKRSAPMSAPKPASVMQEVARMDPDAVGNDRTIAGGDVAEWAGVDESGCVLQASASGWA